MFMFIIANLNHLDFYLNIRIKNQKEYNIFYQKIYKFKHQSKR